MRADRLLSIVLLLQRHHHLTAKALAKALEVTERTIYRDIQALNIAGVPVDTRTGPDGGCFLDERYRTSLNWFTQGELQALLYSTPSIPLSELGMQSAMDNAVLKLLALVSNRHQHEAALMRQRLYLDSSGWYGIAENHPVLPLLKEAVWGDKLIEACYETWEGERQFRTLAPYSLIYKQERWYLAAKRPDSPDMRTYRVSRLTDVRVLPTLFERDMAFDIAAYWTEAAAQFLQRLPSYPVTLRVRPATMTYFSHMLTGRYEVVAQHEDWWVLNVHYTVLEEALTSVLGLGTESEVIEPTALHTAVIERAKAIIAKYGA